METPEPAPSRADEIRGRVRASMTEDAAGVRATDEERMPG
jgi:hypothetical protein